MVNIKVKKLNSFLAKIKGLMFVSSIYPVYLETQFGIHTLFVRKPLDITILDERYIVKHVKVGLKPWRFMFWNPKHFRVLELPHGYIKKYGINISTKVNLEFVD